ncbi:MAG TPA: GAF domain-containing sensor histidine kinase [Thermomicrobiales bacterium]|nr:GAF domain-containing sensor histidine kinase [Thermomicrobiales bacterium]
MRNTVTPQRLRWILILAPLASVVAVEAVRHFLLPEFFASWSGFLTLLVMWLLGSSLFTRFIVGQVDGRHRMVQHQNDELLALHHASLATESELDLERVPERVVDEARQLLGVKYGGLTFFRDDGEIGAFITSGITPDVADAIGLPPKGHGVIGVETKTGRTLRLDDISTHPESVGFPPHHPPMKPLLAVPIRSKNGVFGHLYLADEAGFQFGIRDEETHVRFAALSAVAIENAQLHRQVRTLAITEERERIAREMHDSLAQVLGYVNTKAQAAKVLIASNQTERASAQLDQMATAARSAYADVREGILSLRTSLQPDRSLTDTLREYLAIWQEQSGVSVTLDDSRIPVGALSDLAEVHLLRIVQEALANVRKHAGATEIWIVIEGTGPDVVTTFADNGLGFVIQEREYRGVPQFGLSTMRERAESLGGSFTVTSIPGEGTVIQVRLPAERARSPEGSAS